MEICPMMKRFLIALLLLISPAALFAQSTTVSGTVTDAGSQTWNNGTFSFQFIPIPSYNGPYTWTGGAFNSGAVITGSMNGSGVYSVSIPSNTSITPAGSHWKITVCPQATSPCYTPTTLVTITGATQTLNVTPPAICVAPGPGVSLYSSAEVCGGFLGAQFFLIGTGLQVCTVGTANSCSTWSTAGGGGTSINTYTVATLPVSPAVNTIAIVSDGNGITCSTGGGTTIVLCQFDGTVWNALGVLPSPVGPAGVPQVPTATPSTPQAYALPGLATRQVIGTTNTDTILSTDCNPTSVFYQGSVSVAVALPSATTLQVPACVFTLTNNTTGSATTVVVTPGNAWTIVPNSSGTLTIQQGQSCVFKVDTNVGTQWDADCHDLPATYGANLNVTRGTFGPTVTATVPSGGTSAATQVCELPVGDQSSTIAIQSVQLGPQQHLCYVPIASTVLEIDVAADTGTSNIIVGRNHAGAVSNLTSSALATGSSGAVACSRAAAGLCVDGVTTASATLQNTAIAAGDYIELVSGTADGTAKLFTTHVLITPTAGTAYRSCNIIIGDQSNSAVLTDAQLGPQKWTCYIPQAATLQEIDVAADGGTPNIIVANVYNGVTNNVLSTALATGASGGTACSRATNTNCIGGASASVTLQNTAMQAGSYIQLVSGTAGGVAKLMTVHVTYTLN
jgi:hypothetical protein